MKRFEESMQGGLALVLTGMMLCTGCAIGGAGNANAQHTTATGGSARTDVSLAVSLALGDKVAQAAADLVGGFLNPLKGAISPAQRDEAIQRGVNGGLEQARKEGRDLTPEQKSELNNYVTQEVDKKLSARQGNGNQNPYDGNNGNNNQNPYGGNSGNSNGNNNQNPYGGNSGNSNGNGNNNQNPYGGSNSNGNNNQNPYGGNGQ